MSSYSSAVPEVSEQRRVVDAGLAHGQGSSHPPALATAEPVAWGWLAALTAAAIGLRAVALNQQLWFDEIMTLLDSARAPVWQIVTHYSGQNQHMLYSILAHGSIRLLGEQPWTLRLPAACFGVACVPALYFFARLVTTNGEALAACALMTVNYQHVWFSQNARGYTAMAFWTLVATTFFIRCANGGQRRDWVIYGVTAALGVYTHLMMVFVVAAHAVVYAWMLATEMKARRRLEPAYGFALCGVVSLLLYAPVLPDVLSHTVGAGHDPVRYQWASPLWALAELGRGLRSTTAGGWLALGMGGAILLCGLLSYWKQNRFLVGLMILPGVLTAAGVLATSHNFWPRFFFFEIGFALLILARGAIVTGQFVAQIFGGSRKIALRAGSAMIALLLLASMVPLRAAYVYPKQDYLGAMQFVEQQRQAEEQIVTAGVVASPYRRYYGRAWPRVETRQQLDGLGPGTWLLYAMPASIRTSEPELWKGIESKFTVIRKFPGTLGGGEIYVSQANER